MSEIESEHSSAKGRQQLAALASNKKIDARPAITRRMLVELKKSIKRFGRFSLVVAIFGLTLVAADAIWAIQLGVSYPIAIASAYCTFVASVCLAAAITVLQKDEGPRKQPIAQKPAVSGAWKLAKTFSVSDACRLMCDIEPGAMVTQPCIAWARALLEAIERGELPVVETARGSGLLSEWRGKPNWHSEVSREALKSWTQPRGINPQFLQD